MTELSEKLTWREELDLIENRLADFGAEDYADRLIADGALPKMPADNTNKTRADLILGLERAALYYWFGAHAVEGIKHNTKLRNEPIAQFLKMPPKNRMKRYDDHALIWVMSVIWEHFGGQVGTATFTGSHEKAGSETPSRFMQFCNGWLEHIDPESQPLHRKKFRLAIERAERAGAVARPHSRRRRST